VNNIFVDSDIILDLLLKREPHYFTAANMFSLVEKRKIVAYTTPVVIANIYYISARLTDKKIALENIRKLMSFLRITSVDEKILLLAMDSRFTDFEDAIQYYAAKNQGISYFITRNKSDYKVTDMTICTAAEYLKIYFLDVEE